MSHLSQYPSKNPSEQLGRAVKEMLCSLGMQAFVIQRCW